jgi:hypothetical protein
MPNRENKMTKDTNNAVDIRVPSKVKKVEFRFMGGVLQYREIFKSKNGIWNNFARMTEDGELMRLELPRGHPFRDDGGLIAIYDNGIPFG